MREVAILSVCLLAACGGGGDAGTKQEEAPAATMEAGQWETSFEVRSHASADASEPALKAKVGDKETGGACIAAGGEATPPADMFAGPGYSCTYRSSYVRNNRINAALTCTRAGINGNILMTAQGSSTGTTFEGTVESSSYLPGSGDFKSSRKMSGRKTAAACAAAEPALEKSGQSGG